MKKFFTILILITICNIKATQTDEEKFTFTINIYHQFTEDGFNKHIIEGKYKNDYVYESYTYIPQLTLCWGIKRHSFKTIFYKKDSVLWNNIEHDYVPTDNLKILRSCVLIAKQKYKFVPNNREPLSIKFSISDMKIISIKKFIE